MSLRAIAAEVEREKIVERTTRGKLERARSGRIPQAFGRGRRSEALMMSRRSRTLRQRLSAESITSAWLSMRSAR